MAKKPPNNIKKTWQRKGISILPPKVN